MRADLLHVIMVISNPIRWSTRLRLFKEAIEYMKASGVRLTVVECAFGERPFTIHPEPGVNVVHVRNTTLAWVKECLVNIGISRLPPDWKYLAWIDGDIVFRRADWAAETVHALQHYEIIQPWSDVYDLGPNGEHLYHWRSFCSQYWKKQPLNHGMKQKGYPFPHPGYAWAARRSAIEHLGGLIEFAVAGAGDHHMAYGLIGHIDWSVPTQVTEGYKKSLHMWQARASHHVQGRIGYVPGTIEHFWHGSKQRRKYIERWDILIRNEYDPHADIKLNTYRVVELAGNKPRLEHDLDLYFRSRFEDSNDTGY